MKSSAKKIELASVDDLFSTEEGRQDAKLEKIQEIPLSELHPFRNHPFKVKDDEAMMETADSIKQYGVLVPAIARPDPEGGYELVAGHRRHRASELANKETMPVIVRDLDDDETALSFAEIKALCAGDPRIKERMDLDVEVSRLKLMKADHQSKQYRLEDQLLKYFPEEIEKHKGFIKGFESDLEVLAAHPHPEDGFAGMEIRGDLLTDKENAGAALLDACKEVKTSDPVQIGSYRGYAMSVEFSAWKQEYTLLLKGQMTHRATLGTDPRGNLTRIDNALAQMPQRLEAAKAQLDNLYQQQAAAKEEVGKPFLYEEELRSKNARLVELDTLLNIDGKGQAHTESVVAKSTRPSVLDTLKRPVQPRSTDKKPKQHEEVR